MAISERAGGGVTRGGMSGLKSIRYRYQLLPQVPAHAVGSALWSLERSDHPSIAEDRCQATRWRRRPPTTAEDPSMMRIVATGIVLLSLCSVADAHRLTGTATYYGGSDRLCGSRTASGTRFNCSAMTAAHRTLPFGTVLTVQKGGRSIQVTSERSVVRSPARSSIYCRWQRARWGAAAPIAT